MGEIEEPGFEKVRQESLRRRKNNPIWEPENVSPSCGDKGTWNSDQVSFQNARSVRGHVSFLIGKPQTREANQWCSSRRIGSGRR